MLTPLAKAIWQYTERHQGEHPYLTPIKELILLRADQPHPPSQIVSKPALCIVAAGKKWTSFGDKRYEYEAGQALIVNVEMPSVGSITEASSIHPFLGAVIEFNIPIMQNLIQEMPLPSVPSHQVNHGVIVTNYDHLLADCVVRLIQLLDKPTAIPIIAPVILKEMSYWLLSGPHGQEIAQSVVENHTANKLMQAIHYLRDQFRSTIHIQELADRAHLSLATFHRQFKITTGITPLQYQKQMRLLEARRLMTLDGYNVENAAYTVGYESPSQFSREYLRQFGLTPKKDGQVKSTTS